MRGPASLVAPGPFWVFKNFAAPHRGRTGVCVLRSIEETRRAEIGEFSPLPSAYDFVGHRRAEERRQRGCDAFGFLPAAGLCRLRCGIAHPFLPHRELPLVIVSRRTPATFLLWLRSGSLLALGSEPGGAGDRAGSRG